MLHTQVALGVGERHAHRFGLHALVLQAAQVHLDAVELLHDLVKVVQEGDGRGVARFRLVVVGRRKIRRGRPAVVVDGRRG